MGTTCVQCVKEIDTDISPYIYIEEYYSPKEWGCHNFSDMTFCSWECVRIWVSGK